MCFEKLQRLLMATVITLGAVLIFNGFSLGYLLIGFVVAMATIWGLIDFCPSLWMMEKLGIRSCYANRR